MTIPLLVPNARQPFTSAKIALIVAEQGQGKSTFLTARVVDDTFANVSSVKMPNGYEVKASPALNEKGKPMVGYATIHFPDKKPFMAKVPTGASVIAENIKIFANYHLYGIRSFYVDLAFMLEHINDDLFLDAWLLVDEGYIEGDARNSMSVLNQIITQLGMQMRKRRVRFMIAYPLNKMADLRYRLVRTEYVTCTYNEVTYEVTAEIKRTNEKKKTVTFFAPLYWAYYDTEERFKLPESRINKALKDAY
jgi:hypothetical protein